MGISKRTYNLLKISSITKNKMFQNLKVFLACAISFIYISFLARIVFLLLNMQCGHYKLDYMLQMIKLKKDFKELILSPLTRLYLKLSKDKSV